MPDRGVRFEYLNVPQDVRERVADDFRDGGFLPLSDSADALVHARSELDAHGLGRLGRQRRPPTAPLLRAVGSVEHVRCPPEWPDRDPPRPER